MDPMIHILVADDEPDIRRILRILLEGRGYAVLDAPNGLAAVDMVREHPETDLVIMDIMMPAWRPAGASASVRRRPFCFSRQDRRRKTSWPRIRPEATTIWQSRFRRMSFS